MTNKNRGVWSNVIQGLKVFLFMIVVSLATTVIAVIPTGALMYMGMKWSIPMLGLLGSAIYLIIWLYVAGKVYYSFERFLGREGL